MVSGPSSSAGVSPMRTGVRRTEPTSSVPMRAVKDRSRRCADALTDAERGAREAPGTEGALVQPLDGERVVGRFRQDGDREIVHGISAPPDNTARGQGPCERRGCPPPRR